MQYVKTRKIMEIIEVEGFIFSENHIWSKVISPPVSQLNMTIRRMIEDNPKNEILLRRYYYELLESIDRTERENPLDALVYVYKKAELLSIGFDFKGIARTVDDIGRDIMKLVLFSPIVLHYCNLLNLDDLESYKLTKDFVISEFRDTYYGLVDLKLVEVQSSDYDVEKFILDCMLRIPYSEPNRSLVLESIPPMYMLDEVINID